ncbi:MAG: patatin-like phospholipase family protein [Ilumatobacteraceae bacterium]
MSHEHQIVEHHQPDRTAFVLSGGANLGAVQVGMLRALDEHGIRPDVIVGASVGAINGAWLAGNPPGTPIDELEEIWLRLRRGDIFPMRFGLGLAGFLGRRASLVDAAGLRRLLERHVRFDRLEDARIPLHVVVTDVLDGRDIALSAGPAVDIVAASSAIPGVFPPVVVNDRTYIDGGVVNNAPVSHAVELGVDRIYVLPTGYACSLDTAPTSALGVTLHALSLMVNRRLSLDVDHYLGHTDLRVVPPPCPIDVGPGDFSRARDLIERGYDTTRAWLDGQARLAVPNPIAQHEHRHVRRSSPIRTR